MVGYLSETEYMPSIEPFQQTRDGQGALLALKVQNMENLKWDAIIKKSEQTILIFLWNEKNQKFVLNRHIAVQIMT